MQILERFLLISTTDPDDARRRKILNILLTVIGFASFVSIFIFFTEVELLIGSAITFVGIGILFIINARYSGRLATFLFLIFITIIFTFSDTPEQVSSGRALFTFTIPIFMASILLSPAMSFGFAIANSLIIYLLASSFNGATNIPAIIGFFLIAFVSWLSARSLEDALKELRTINANLDQVVADRTKALAESLSRERIEAGRSRAILNSIADGVIVFDKNWNASQVNPAIKGMLDIPLELIQDKSFRDLIEHPRLSPKSRPLLYAMLEHGTQPIGFRIEWGNKTLSISAAQVYDIQAQYIGTVIVFRDFTREAEVERMKSTFVGIVSHELRTPLNAILGYAEMFKESVYGPVNEKQSNMAERIMKNTQRLLGLINDLLDQAQMEAGKLTIRAEIIHTADILETLHGTMDKAASDKHLKLTSEIDLALPDTFIGDPARLQQILINLVGNALKFTQQGSVHIKLFRQNLNQWGIIVTDTGKGIPEDELPYIFETFHQVDSDPTREHGGFGLGLAIVKQLVNLMNGEINVQSETNKGTTFTITLPLILPDGISTKWSNV